MRKKSFKYFQFGMSAIFFTYRNFFLRFGSDFGS